MSGDEVVLYSNPRSRGRMAHWMLEEVGAPYRVVTFDFAKGEHKAPDFLAINPMGKVPAIVHRGTTVTETAAILAYLADAFPDAGLAPATDDPAPKNSQRMFERPPVSNRGALGYGSYEDVLATLKGALSPGPYLLGERFTAADLYLGALLGFAIQFGAKDVAAEPVFAGYVGRVTGRPAHGRVDGATA